MKPKFSLYQRHLANYLLLPFAAIFYLLTAVRRFFYQMGWFKTQHFNKPIIVVGNITVGGTGKTPMVMALVKHFKQSGKKVGVVSSGYGGSNQKGSLLVDKNTPAVLCGDEPLLIALECEIAVMVNKNRAAAAGDLLSQCQLDVIISDDGLQHYALGRAVEIAVVDGFGNGFLLPAGALREPKSRLKSVDFVINNGAVSAGEFGATLQLRTFINLKTKVQKPLDFFANQRCFAVAGLGNPQRFFDTLRSLQVQVQEFAFPDHHNFTAADLFFDKTYPIIMSAKDCVKCRLFATEQMWYLQTETELDADFLAQLDAKL